MVQMRHFCLTMGIFTFLRYPCGGKLDDQLAEPFFHFFYRDLGIPPTAKIHLFILLISQTISSWANSAGTSPGAAY